MDILVNFIFLYVTQTLELYKMYIPQIIDLICCFVAQFMCNFLIRGGPEYSEQSTNTRK